MVGDLFFLHLKSEKSIDFEHKRGVPGKGKSENFGWYELRRGKNWREYCNKHALICNRLRAVSKIGVDTGASQKI